MPSVPFTQQARVGRFRDQRWLLDSVIRMIGPEFDQSRLHGGSPSSQLGTPFFLLMADWLADRAAGKPLNSTYNLIDRTGHMHTEPYGEARTYQYGAPLGWGSSGQRNLPLVCPDKGQSSSAEMKIILAELVTV